MWIQGGRSRYGSLSTLFQDSSHLQTESCDGILHSAHGSMHHVRIASNGQNQISTTLNSLKPAREKRNNESIYIHYLYTTSNSNNNNTCRLL
mmetsp:Transcript_39754/g.96013  ORF Transcript_39754/g.96013 Transcript_39754/m.96013 type:complete len:92 (+) Transcript_39754:922-1197(+)